MLNFSVGPVQMSEEIRTIGFEQIPYFRTIEFSELMKENERLIKKFVHASEQSRAIFMTGSGTSSMEASVINIFNSDDNILVVNGGSFGARFAEICKIHDIPYTEIKLEYGQILTIDELKQYDGKGYTGFLINMHETSTGVLYDMKLVSEFCKKNNLKLVVDAISSFIADEINMEELGITAIILGSQKALALPPGISIIILNSDATNIIKNNNVKSMYFNLKSYLTNGERGQTPFTPAVSILIQLSKRLKMIDEIGFANEQAKIANIASDFREKIKKLPFRVTSHSLSNTVTPLTHVGNVSAYKIFEILKDEYNIWVCPNGGELADKIFRVGHIGELTIDDNNVLIEALTDMQKRGII